MSAIDTMTAGKGFGLGFLLAAVNPKNLLMGAAAGLAIGGAGLDVGAVVVAILVFTLVAACSVAMPVIAYLVASERMAGRSSRFDRGSCKTTRPSWPCCCS